MSNELDILIRSQFCDLQAKYPGLSLIHNAFGEWLIKGDLKFLADFGAVETISDTYEIEILIPQNFPATIPEARDLSGRTKGFHTYPNGSLCLGAPLAVKITFSNTPTLLGFVDNCIIPFLYSFSYQIEHGELPFGDLSHGNEGKFEYYKDFFEVDNYLAVVGFLRILADDDYRGHLECLCGSGNRLRNCHGDKLRHANSFQTPGEFMSDYCGIVIWLHEKGEKIPLSYFSKNLSKHKTKQPEVALKRQGV